MLPSPQGDQIGRIFAHWAIVFFGQLLKITEVAQIFDALLFKGERYKLILRKTGWATFWAIFSQTHLVTPYV
jgi:hypothetical protein